MRWVKSVNCPYCKHRVVVQVDLGQFPKKQVVACDPESGGCSEDFVIESRAEIKISSYAIKRIDAEPTSIDHCPNCGKFQHLCNCTDEEIKRATEEVE